MENNREILSYEFADFSLEIGAQRLLLRGEAIHLAKRHFQILLYLIEHRAIVVSRYELLQKFWYGHDVYDDALGKCVGAIRRALADTGGQPRYIETRRGSGYKFIGPVVERDGSAKSNEPGVIRAAIENGGSSFAKSIDAQIIRPGARPVFQNRSILTALVFLLVLSVAAFSLFTLRRSETSAVEIAPTADVAAKPTFAILPIRNLTGKAENDYLSDGLTESLINEASRIENLKVISRGSAFQFRDKDVSAKEIGERLGVETILEGGLRLSGERIRLDVRLVRTSDGQVVWASDSEKEDIGDIFAIQDGITCQIVTELRVKLCGEVAPAERYTKNINAYRLYLKGMYYRNQLSKENLEKAAGFFEKALEQEPDYALAHQGLAAVYTLLEANSHVAPGTASPKAIFHAEKALQSDPTLSDALVFLGTARTINNYDFRSRDDYYLQALARNPNSRMARLWLANDLTIQGRFEEAESQILSARELDPLSFGVKLNLAELYYYWRRSGQAIEQAKLMLLEYPDDPTTLGLLAKFYVQNGDIDKALAVVEKLPANDSNRTFVLAAAGKIDEARKLIKATIASEKADVSPYWVGCIYAVTGEPEKAFEWLEKAYTARQADLISIKIDPALDSLHNDPRFTDLATRVGLAQ